MNSNVINVVNEEGKDILTKLLKPFFSTIEPAFFEHASEIILEAPILNKGDKQLEASVSFKKDGRTYALKIDENYHPLITSSRIKIIAGISIALIDGIKNGKMRIRYDKELINVKVQTILRDNHETVILIPQWGNVT